VSRTCRGHVVDMSRACLEREAYGACLGHVVDMSWTCLGHVSSVRPMILQAAVSLSACSSSSPLLAETTCTVNSAARQDSFLLDKGRAEAASRAAKRC